MKKEHYPNEFDVSVSNIKILLKGNGSTRAAFFGVWLVGGFLLSITLNLIFIGLSMSIENGKEIFSWYHSNEINILLFYFVFATIVVWRNTICKRKYWLYFVRVFTLWVVVANGYEIFKNI